MISVEVVIQTINIEVSLTGAVNSTVVCLDADAELRNTANTFISTTAIPSGTKSVITAPDASIENSDTSYTASAVSDGTFVLPNTTYNIYVASVLQATQIVPTLKDETININWT